MSDSSSPDQSVLVQAASERPLSHPMVMSVAEMDYEYAIPEHLREIYGAVYRAFSEKHPRAPRNLARIQPREHGKSEVGAHVIPSWKALQNPNIRILLMSETETLAKGKLRECRDTIERLGPKYGVRVEESNKTELTLERTATWDAPTIQAAGFETGVTGKHFDLLIFDDIVSWESQRTEARREKKWQMFQDYLNLGSEGESIYLVLGTRKHPDDLYSNLIDGPAWDTIVRQAISDWSVIEDGDFVVVTDADNRYDGSEIDAINPREETIVDVEPYREVDVLWPARWSLDKLILDLISGYGGEQGSLVWRRENQNDAEALQGQVLSEDMLSWVDTLQGRVTDYTWYAGLDPAIEDDPEKAATNDTDYWALALLAHEPGSGMTYVRELQRKRGMTLAQGLNWTERVLAGYPEPRTILAESQQAQRWFVQEARDRGLPVESTSSSGNKKQRIIDMSSRFESGRVQLVAPNGQTEKWASFVSEWAGFPTNRHDDRLDAIEIALRNVDGDGGGKARIIKTDPW